jgi:sulfotransferase
MRNGIHFISGLPRSGSTLLVALLRQNPRFCANVTSPLSFVFLNMLYTLGGSNESHVYITEDKRERVLRGLFENFYEEESRDHVIFDCSRIWTAKVGGLARLFPEAKMVCCVRSLSWIHDSFERIAQKSPLEPSRIYNFEPNLTVTGRVESLQAPKGAVGSAYHSLRDAYFGENADRLLVVRYESLTRDPVGTLASIYDFLGEPSFEHDLENVEIDAEEFDAHLRAPGLHRVERRVAERKRETILPPDLFEKFARSEFWLDAERNPRGVRVV